MWNCHEVSSCCETTWMKCSRNPLFRSENGVGRVLLRTAGWSASKLGIQRHGRQSLFLSPSVANITRCKQLINDMSYFFVFLLTSMCINNVAWYMLLTCPKRIEILAKDLSTESWYVTNILAKKKRVCLFVTSEQSVKQPERTWALQGTFPCSLLKSLPQKLFQGRCLFEHTTDLACVTILVH